MNILLWILQIALAGKFVSVGYTHGVRPDPTKMQPGIERLGSAARPLLIVITLLTFLGAIALILPAATGIAAWLTPWAAAALALLALVSIGLHIRCREHPLVVADLILAVLAALVAYGRWVIVPL
jgi:uncharacterized membrane protein YphA (DoxX/SURF4 family)